MTPRHFTADYVERATLRDGTPVVLRLLAPEDKDVLRAGFDRLSPESRYLRFHSPKPRLTDEELRYLCDVDQEEHVALGAVSEGGDGEGGPVGLGIARFIRLPDRPGEPVTAEAAIAVADEVHGKGLGKLLFLRLIAAAEERGIGRFHCEVLGHNASMQMLLDRFAPEHVVSGNDGIVSFDIPLPAVAPDEPVTAEPPAGPLYQLFREAARRVLQIASLPLRGKTEAEKMS